MWVNFPQVPFFTYIIILSHHLPRSPSIPSCCLSSFPPPCGFCSALSCFRPSLRTGSSTECAAAFEEHRRGEKNMSFLWEQLKASLTSSQFIKLSCQRHIIDRQLSFHQRKRGRSTFKKTNFSFAIVLSFSLSYFLILQLSFTNPNDCVRKWQQSVRRGCA